MKSIATTAARVLLGLVFIRLGLKSVGTFVTLCALSQRQSSIREVRSLTRVNSFLLSSR